MHRLLVDTSLLESVSPSLPKDAVRHLKVLRPEEGESFELFDGKGAWRVYSHSGGVLAAVGDICREERAAHPPLTLFACVTKGSRWDWTIEKATELGARRIVPVISDRTIVRIAGDEREAKRERWTRVAEDAARQSDARWIPDVLAPVSFRESLALVAETTCFVGAIVEPPARPILAEFALRRGECAANGGGVSVFVGPEGDFTPEELSELLKVAHPVSLGPTVLRAETAAIFALGAIAAAMQEQCCRPACCGSRVS